MANYAQDYSSDKVISTSEFYGSVDWRNGKKIVELPYYEQGGGNCYFDTGSRYTVNSNYTLELFDFYPNLGITSWNDYHSGILITLNGDIIKNYEISTPTALSIGTECEDTAHKVGLPTNVYNGTGMISVPIKMKFMGWVKIFDADNYYAMFPLFVEQARILYTNQWFDMKWDDVSTKPTYEPSEEINVHIYAGVHNYKREISSAQIGALTATYSYPVSANINVIAPTYPTQDYTVGYLHFGYSDYENYEIRFSVIISDWSSKQYLIEAISGRSFDIYAGKEVGNDFLNAYRVKYVRSNSHGSSVTYPKSSLEKSKMSVTTFSNGASTFNFTYDISDITETSVTSISCTVSTHMHHLKTVENGRYNNVQRTTTYHLDDVIDTVDLSNAGSLVYDDGTTISLSDLNITAQSTACSLGTLPVTVGLGTPSSFTITYTITATYFGTLTIEDACVTASDSQIKSIVLSGEKHVFNPNEVIGFGDDAQIQIIAMDDSVIETISSANIMSRIRNVDAKYGSYARDYLTDGKVTLTFTCEGAPLTHEICFCYDETALILDISDVQTSHIIDENFTAFDFTDLVAKKKTHTNSYSNGVVTTTVTETVVSSPTIATNPSAINYNNEQTYGVTVSTTNTWGQQLTGTFNVSTTPLAITGVFVSGSGNSIKYYDNGVDTFKEPTDLSFEIVYNDSSRNVTLDSDDVKYYIDANHSSEISVGDVINSANLYNQNTIFFYSEDYDCGGSFTLNFIPDPIVSVALHSTISLFLGNKLNKTSVKSQVVLDCTHESGNVTQLSDPNAYTFKNTSVITSIPSSNLVVNINGTGEKEITNTSTKITWNKPYAKLRVDNSNFQTSYNNKTDIIDPTPIGVTMEYYEDALFTTKCDYELACTYSSSATVLYNKFTVAGVSALSGYNFGTDALNINMGADSDVAVQFTITVKNQFYDSSDANQPQYVLEDITATETVHVIEILNITGIKLLNVKRDYVVGESFLNENDDTQIRIFYNDTNNNAKTYTCLLRSGLTALNIYPTPNTVFNNVVNDKVVTVTSASNYNVSAQYSIDVKPNFEYNENKTHKCVVVWLDNYTCPDGVARSKYYLVERTATINGEEQEITSVTDNGRVLINGISVSDVSVVGYLDNVQDTSKNAIVVLFDDYVSPMEGSNNVEVKYPCYVAGNADLINKCHFGIMFGNNNSKNRLFLSGNPNHKNKDWHTGQVDATHTKYDDMINGNYGYFEDLSVCAYGETDNAIVGYDIVSNDKLLVLKSQSDKETTVYFRQPQLVTAINGSGTAVTGLDDETLYQEEFSLSKGNNSVAGVNPHAVINFNGDSLFVSNEKQIVGLDLTGIIGDNQRYANSRSHFIDEDLLHYDLYDVFMWSNNKYLFVVLPDKIYVAHYQLRTEDQYEWFVIDVPNVTCILEHEDTLYFGTNKGEIFRFVSKYKDAKKIFVGYGATKLNANDETELITASMYLEPIDSEKKHFFRPTSTDVNVNSYIYYSLGTVVNNSSADCDFYVDNGDSRNLIELVARRNGVTDVERRDYLLKMITEKEPVFLNRIYNAVDNVECVDGSVLANAWGNKYYLKEFDDETSLRHLYKVLDENGNEVPVKELYRARLCMRVTREMEMSDIDVSNGSFKLKLNNQVLDIVQYNRQPLNAFRGEVIEYSNVEAFYIPRPETMGTLEHFKTIWSFTVTNDSNVPSELDLCYASNKIPSEKLKTLAYITLSKEQMGFSFEDFDFREIDFDKNVVPRTYTHKRVLSNVKFVCFAFRNYKDTNCVLGSMSITYSLPYPSYGGD